ncbi:type VI secretion system, FHA domain-containing protein [Marinobacter santoriniensis NKSG1]|uniref:Type VI secretion system, FHA domain-containing protein n=1 Tax=Marinobacter santoriniensis NKSG1 TaxID=1288826 RepID=M7DB86_9GAMM|nr:type VI secretion system-associated FHA domain protein TagH [Marinobacter santoriniensis]EMP54917.1 type VI secretion system, FHA domain-containing protein [Marinobacter santoriniensis NKSG1]
MERQPTAVLKLTVTNPTAMNGGADIEHRFDAAGGSIGTAVNDTWRLSSQRTGALAGHAEVRFMEGDFCLIDRSGRTFINSARQPVGRGRRARLNHGDTLAIGRYQIRAELVCDDASTVWSEEPGDDDRLINGQAAGLVRAQVRDAEPGGCEPLEGIEPVTPAVESDDPMLHWPDGAKPFETPRLRGGQEQQSRKHIGAAPLIHGMDCELDFADSAEMQLFLEEVGQTLQATVEGLLALHRGEDSHHRALRTRLQPIEDNPLRLGESYEDTIETLFAGQRSPVHLSAPAAVRESLDSLNQHQQATRVAIREALDAILHAFSPQALLRRFHGYRRGLRHSESEEQWAWDMYQHYYRELNSSRQHGFERLFQEVFDQAYDQHLRQLQRENLK